MKRNYTPAGLETQEANAKSIREEREREREREK
jgi:hypothetical protein